MGQLFFRPKIEHIVTSYVVSMQNIVKPLLTYVRRNFHWRFRRAEKHDVLILPSFGKFPVSTNVLRVCV